MALNFAIRTANRFEHIMILIAFSVQFQRSIALEAERGVMITL